MLENLDTKKFNLCCDVMESIQERGLSALEYDPAMRSYTILEFVPYKKRREASPIANGIYYCPWCGTKLPEELSEQYHAELLAEHGMEWEYDKQHLIPEEFRTEKWWKKRGL